MDLIDDDEAQIAKEGGHVCVAVEKHGLERFGRNLKDTRWAAHESLLLSVGDVAVPMPDRDVAFGTDVVEAQELVVDEGLERRDVKTADGGRRLLLHERDDGEEGCLRLTGGGGSAEQQVGVGAKEHVTGSRLYGAERVPAATVDVVANGWGIASVDVHTLQGKLGKFGVDVLLLQLGFGIVESLGL